MGKTGIGGPLPAEFFSLVSLEDFVVPQAKFTGRLEAQSWLSLIELAHLDISFNDFSGTVPSIFTQLNDLGTSLA